MAEYLIPSAPDVPHMTLDHTTTPSPTNPLGVKGIGEAGTIGSAAAVMNAVVDALRPLGVTNMPMPASPVKVWSTIEAAKAGEGDSGGERATGTADAPLADTDTATRWRTHESSPHDGGDQ